MVYNFSKFTVETLITGRWKENCYFVRNRETGDLAIIDPGDNPETIALRVDEAGGAIRHILLTHGHHDHLGAAFELCKRSGLQLGEHMVEATVHGTRNALMGNAVVARVSLQRDEDPIKLTTRLRKFCRERLAPHMVPVRFTVVSQSDQYSERAKKVRQAGRLQPAE